MKRINFHRNFICLTSFCNIRTLLFFHDETELLQQSGHIPIGNVKEKEVKQCDQDIEAT